MILRTFSSVISLPSASVTVLAGVSGVEGVSAEGRGVRPVEGSLVLSSSARVFSLARLCKKSEKEELRSSLSNDEEGRLSELEEEETLERGVAALSVLFAGEGVVFAGVEGVGVVSGASGACLAGAALR